MMLRAHSGKDGSPTAVLAATAKTLRRDAGTDAERYAQHMKAHAGAPGASVSVGVTMLELIAGLVELARLPAVMGAAFATLARGS